MMNLGDRSATMQPLENRPLMKGLAQEASGQSQKK